MALYDVPKRLFATLMAVQPGWIRAKAAAVEDGFDYLFEDPAPEHVSADWIRSTRAIQIREDPDFVLVWDEDESADDAR